MIEEITFESGKWPEINADSACLIGTILGAGMIYLYTLGAVKNYKHGREHGKEFYYKNFEKIEKMSEISGEHIDIIIDKYAETNSPYRGNSGAILKSLDYFWKSGFKAEVNERFIERTEEKMRKFI